jgi:hypothetical protein
MIRFKEFEEKKVKGNPYYILTIDYMIGDADGDTDRETELSVNNPFIERFCKILDKLKPTKGYWGISFSSDRLYNHYKEGQISIEDFTFLYTLMNYSEVTDEEYLEEIGDGEFFDEYFENLDRTLIFKVQEEQVDFIEEFASAIVSETGYSFITYERYSLIYVDENGKEWDTYFE